MNRRSFLTSLSAATVAAQGRSSLAAKHSHRVLGCDRGHATLLGPDGAVHRRIANRFVAHDVWMLPGGNLLLHRSPVEIAEIAPDDRVVWRHVSRPKPGYDGKVEVHGFQRLANGLTMIAESGNRRIIEVDASGRIVNEVPLVVENPDPHRDTRLARKLPNGGYLVCHEGDGAVREYDPSGKVVWSYRLDLNGRPRTPGHGPEGHGKEVFGAIRRPDGNTLIACGNGNRVIEVTPRGDICWSVEQKELPGITLAWVTTLHLLPNGNLVFGNTHAGPDNPQLIEVTREKKVVWTLRDWTNFGNDLAAAQVLAEDGPVLR